MEKTLRATAIQDPEYRRFREKTSHLNVLGHRLPVLHTMVKKGFSFYQKSPKEILEIWDYCWKQTQTHEALTLPLLYYRHHPFQLNSSHWHLMKNWVKRVENWEHSDALSYLYSVIYEKFPTLVEPTLYRWNRSKNRWEQRASIVSLIYYASAKRKTPPITTILNLVEPLIKQRDHYVAKAVGWTLREAYKLYPKETLIFLQKHVHNLAPDSFSYATEKLTNTQKQQLKMQRS